MNEIIRNPKTVKDLAAEIIKVCDSYWSRQMSEDEAKGYVFYWAKHESKKLFRAKEFNSTIVKIVGKKRMELVGKFLENMQIEI